MNSSISFYKRMLLVVSLAVLAGCATSRESLQPATLQGEALKIAVLPFENLSRTGAPLKGMRQAMIGILRKDGANILDDDSLEKFMARHRMRYMGGIKGEDAAAIASETGTGAVLITDLENYSEVIPPKIALVSRLVSTERHPKILWTDSVGLSGDDSPGILGVGLIEDPAVLTRKAMGLLTVSLERYLAGKKTADRGVPDRSFAAKFAPKLFFRSPVLDPGHKYTVAVVPFLNKSSRKNAGEIVALQFVKELAANGNFKVIEPGVVREEFLKYRIIMEEGVSLSNADIFFTDLDADLVLTGTVTDYQDYQGFLGTPKVAFSTILLDRKSREVVWSSRSRNEGNEGVYLFDMGKVNTSDVMTGQMARAVVEMMVGK